MSNCPQLVNLVNWLSLKDNGGHVMVRGFLGCVKDGFGSEPEGQLLIKMKEKHS